MNWNIMLIYLIGLVGAGVALYAQQLWLAGTLLYLAGNFKIISVFRSSEHGWSKFGIFCLIGFNFACLNLFFG